MVVDATWITRTQGSIVGLRDHMGGGKSVLFAVLHLEEGIIDLGNQPTHPHPSNCTEGGVRWMNR